MLFLSGYSISNHIALYQREFAVIERQAECLLIEPAQLSSVTSAVDGFEREPLAILDESLQLCY